MNRIRTTLFIVSTLLTAACTHDKEESTVQTDLAATAGFVTLTGTQYSAANIAYGKIEHRIISSTLRVNGVLDVPPQNHITIAAPMGGFVKATRLLAGMKIKKGDVLVTLENQDYILLQQDYLDNRSKLQYLEAEYNRQRELVHENVSAQKALQQARAQYESTAAIVKGLAARLAMINISPASLEKEGIRSHIYLYAPADGFVTDVNVNTGRFVNATDVMFRIVNLDHMHAELQVYEKDIHKIATGQKVTLQLANETTPRDATVFLTGREISAERTVRVHCHLLTEDSGLLPGMYVTADIETDTTGTDVVPTSALVNFEGDDVLFIGAGEQGTFRMIVVNTADTAGEYTPIQVPPGLDRHASIVVKGAFELLGVLKNTQEE